ncbi:unnamed protein product [Prorocentrum cordatum]|uniref:Syndecan n=1 Tax=Prorocentrum cordatum TaxID=2364126 RepID=A0ABN9VFN6_9DINO|nr:unnamed protein product [Polarella glacialis]
MAVPQLGSSLLAAAALLLSAGLPAAGAPHRHPATRAEVATDAGGQNSLLAQPPGPARSAARHPVMRAEAAEASLAEQSRAPAKEEEEEDEEEEEAPEEASEEAAAEAPEEDTVDDDEPDPTPTPAAKHAAAKHAAAKKAAKAKAAEEKAAEAKAAEAKAAKKPVTSDDDDDDNSIAPAPSGKQVNTSSGSPAPAPVSAANSNNSTNSTADDEKKAQSGGIIFGFIVGFAITAGIACAIYFYYAYDSESKKDHQPLDDHGYSALSYDYDQQHEDQFGSHDGVPEEGPAFR